MIQLTRRGIVAPTDGDTRRLAEEFAAAHCIKMEGFLEPAIRDRIGRAIDEAPFVERVHEGLEPPATDLCIDAPAVRGRLLFLMNDPALFRLVETITGCDPLQSFNGIVYRIVPSTHHGDSWHDDLHGSRRIAMSVNFSPQGYRGGVLQIRDKDTKQVLSETGNTGFGDAILFRLAPRLQHRLTPLDAGPPKTAWAGWFCAGPLPAGTLEEIGMR